MITVDLLGPTITTWDGNDVSLTGICNILMLILAIASANAATSTHLQESAWPQQQPDDKTAARLRSAIRVIRSHFAASHPQPPPQAACPPRRAAVSGFPGYLLPAVQTDASTFSNLADQARLSLQHDDPQAAWQQARDALGLWRGAPLADADGRPFAVKTAGLLEHKYLSVETTRCDAAIRLGLHREIIADLRRLSASWPGDFGLTCLLVTALARSGRFSEAADACHRAVCHANEYNIDPTPQRQLQYDLLNGKVASAGSPWAWSASVAHALVTTRSRS